MTTDTQNLLDVCTEATDLKIKIIGVGGAGTNAVDELKIDVPGDVGLAAVNTDAKALLNSSIAEKLIIGHTVTRGLGAGGQVDVGRKAVESDREAIEKLIAEMDLIILVVGLGGGTGSAAAPFIAEMAAKTESLVLVFATLPFNFEGARQSIAEESLGELRKRVHGLISLPNDMLLQEGEEGLSALNAFSVANRWIGRGVNSLCTMLLKTGLINQDFNSLRSVFQNRGGKTIFSTGSGSGSDYVKDALGELFLCPLFHLGDQPAIFDRILVNVIGGADLGIAKVNEIMSQVAKRFDSREDIVFGVVIDENRNESLEICILAKAGMEQSPVSKSDKKVETTEPKRIDEGLGLESEIAQDDKVPHPVHKSKLSKKAAAAANQGEFDFTSLEAQRGYFLKTVRNLYKNEDLDVPTYFRRGIKIKIKPS